MSQVERIDCARARAAAHGRLDGDALAPADAAWLESHLAACGACRTAVQDLATIQGALRAVPVPPFPAHALDQVWARTSRAVPLRRAVPRGSVWRVAAVAAGLALVLGGLWWTQRPPAETQPASAAEVRRATEEARLVLGVAASALARTERAATDGALVRGIGQALDRTSIRWSGAPASRPKGGQGV